MSRWLLAFVLALACGVSARAQGLLVPTDQTIPPLPLQRHQVTVSINEQVASTHVEQTFRNDTSRALEATYLFPVPAGAAVDRFVMWVNGEEIKGELVEAEKARKVYTDIVRRTRDPGLLEYVGQRLLRVRVFPVPAHGEQKLAVHFTAINQRDGGLVEYLYPLKTDRQQPAQGVDFSLDVTLQSEHKLQTIYSPSHKITLSRKGDHQAKVYYQAKQAKLDQDFQLFYSLGDREVGLTVLPHRPDPEKPGTFLMLITPRAEVARAEKAPRDVVFVVDTSGSMNGKKMAQARRAVQFCLDSLNPEDRFAVVGFATSTRSYATQLEAATPGEIERARKWVSKLEASGGTAIESALQEALSLRPDQDGRTFTVIFLTDGQPTVGQTDPQKILQTIEKRNTAGTRIFTFGVGDDVNAVLLDRLASKTRAVSTYVRPAEDIEVKVSSLYAKVSHPVLTHLKLTSGENVTLSEMYPGQLPDLFHDGQLVVLGQYRGEGHVALTLTGKVGTQQREFVYEVKFPGKTGNEKEFVAGLWARRKVGYLLDQIRTNGKNQELVDEVVRLAKKHGITTPYTSYLVVPDEQPTTVTAVPRPVTPVRTFTQPTSAPNPVSTRGVVSSPVGHPPRMEDGYRMYSAVQHAPQGFTGPAWVAPGAVRHSAPRPSTSTTYPVLNDAEAVGPAAQPSVPRSSSVSAPWTPAQTGRRAVELALQLKGLREQAQLSGSTSRKAAGKVFLCTQGVWIDQTWKPDLKTVTIKALSKAYFRILARHPEVREVFQLGNRIAWVTPGGTALVIDPQHGQEELADDRIDELFPSKP